MNAVAYYSNTDESRLIAEYFSNELGFPLINIEKSGTLSYQSLVLVFPVHCQNIPEAVKKFLNKITVENLTAIATYGKMCHGNVLYEIQKKHGKTIVAAAYVPTKHSYIEYDSRFSDYEKLASIVNKVKNPTPVKLPSLYKNPLANIFPKWRSRLGLKIKRGANCDGCNTCKEVCSSSAIDYGITNQSCIRCLKCVNTCPKKALTVKISLALNLYLKKKKLNKLIFYL